MVRSMQTTLGVWMRAVATVFAIMTMLMSATMLSHDIDRPDQITQVAVVSVTDDGSASEGHDTTVQTVNCHFGHSCVFVIMPDEVLALLHMDSARAFPMLTEYLHSSSQYPPYHPPRALSQV